jgi:uncharacterized membrane protein YidH (DUF202 family)
MSSGNTLAPRLSRSTPPVCEPGDGKAQRNCGVRFLRQLWYCCCPPNEFAIGRDILALERTFLAMVRTSVTASSLGVAVAVLLSSRMARIIGTLMVALSQFMVVIALWRFTVQSASLGQRSFSPDTVLPWFIVVLLGTALVLSIVVVFR